MIPAKYLKGKRLHIQAAMKAVGGAEASVVVFEIGKDDKIINYTILLSFFTDTYKIYENWIRVSEQTEQLYINCATSSRVGEVYFDDLVIEIDEREINSQSLAQSRE